VPNRAVRPLDAAGLLLIRDNGGPEILLGRRRRKARAFPGEYVVPGGLVEAGDHRPSGFPETLPEPAAGLDGMTRRNLGVFARAALRECYEETGLLLVAGDRRAAAHGAARSVARHRVWQAFGEISLVPAFAALLPVARAITPLGYPRRFHSRFFMTVLGGSAQVRPADPARPLAGDGELEDLGWVPVAETRTLPLAAANAVILAEILGNLMTHHRPGAPWPGALAGAAAPCFTWRGPGEHQYRTVIPRKDT
jgi:8-oxo-dGTP pyrophosphatase MutT (NUDIX family)